MQGPGYFIDTSNGKIEVSKGAYLTFIKRKGSTIKTTRKTKSIGRITSNLTVKKSFTHSKARSFFQKITHDRDIFTSLPPMIIPMELDNDCES